MGRTVKILLTAVVALALLVLIGAAALYGWISHPKPQRLPLPPTLIALDSAGGEQLLAESAARHDYDALLPNFQAQEKISWCGVASGVTVLNTLQPVAPLRQEEFFNDCAGAWWRQLQVSFGGMPLALFTRLVTCHDVAAEAVHADQSSLERFRTEIAANLETSVDFVVVNYDRAALGQGEGGHISPLGAYHAGSDRFLVLDVAGYKYPPVWVTAEDLWRAMDSVDSETGQRRGYVLIRQQQAQEPAAWPSLRDSLAP